MQLRAVEGKLSELYDHFEEHFFESCEATDTRLMGVVAMRITWRSKENPRALFYQVLHLDYSEYGIDDYFEFDCTPNSTTYQENHEAMKYHWHAFTSVMGGKTVHISPAVMLRLIEDALPLAADGIEREYDNEENLQFRHNATVRLELMRNALAHEGFTSDDCTAMQAISAVSPHQLTITETINYFLMRLVDLDYPAAMYLSELSEDELRDCELTSIGLQTLMRNQIRPGSVDNDTVSSGHPYRCRLTTLGTTNYYHSGVVVYLNGDYRKRDCRVTAVAVGSIDRMTTAEAAMQLAQSEYITVFDCRDRMLNNFDSEKFSFLSGVDPQHVPNGWLYTIYNSDNSHVNSADYRLSDDVYGYALLSIDGEFVLMSNKLSNIEKMDDASILSIYSPFLRLDGRYQLDTPIFHNLCSSQGIMFRELIERPEYGD